MNRKNKESIGNRLKNAFTDLHVDIFGYEKQVHHNITSYFQTLEQKIAIPKDRILIRIFKDQGHIRSCIYYKGGCKHQIQLKELIMLFTGVSPSTMENQVERTIKTIFKDFAKAHKVDAETLQLCIVSFNKKGIVKLVNSTRVIGEIPIKTLIPYFI